MKHILTLIAAAALLAIVLAAGLHPVHGVFFANPLATLGTFLIGLGLLRNAQQRTAQLQPFNATTPE